jgi:hypothetical protein
MSIYRRQDWVYGHNVPHAPGGGSAPTPVNPRSGDSSAGSPDWSQHRKAQPAEHLLPSSENWMDHLPSTVFPGALASQYPRIVNHIAMAWNDRQGCQAYFAELLVDRRGCRRGFPDAVKRDLLKLLDHWYGHDASPGSKT